MDDLACAEGTSPDLFGDQPCRPQRNPIVLPKAPPELRAARALSAQMRGRLARHEKQKIAHLICLNLISMLRQGARR